MPLCASRNPDWGLRDREMIDLQRPRGGRAAFQSKRAAVMPADNRRLLVYRCGAP